MWNRIMNLLFTKSQEQTLKEMGDKLESGWSPDDPIKVDAAGNITHHCAGAAYAAVPRRNPGAWSRMTNVMGGIAPTVNHQPGMTQEKIVEFVRRAQAGARADRA